jgi:hypothetical protein
LEPKTKLSKSNLEDENVFFNPDLEMKYIESISWEEESSGEAFHPEKKNPKP